MIREEELNDKKILETLQQDPIERNEKLQTFIRLLNSVRENSFLTIDGKWGSGKTVFVKQIDYLSTCDASEIKTPLGQDAIKQFQENYITYYYNAWENDYHEDPLQSLLFNLINDFWGRREKIADTGAKVSKAFINSAIKAVSLSLINSDEIRKVENISDLVKSITTARERKDAINDIINNYLDLKGKKLLFIIDELDRCKPTFAVQLLEVVKHYYTNDKLVFLLSTNNQQLAHTIQKVYGANFDGASYLNKFYDLIFDLPPIDTEKYINYLGKGSDSGYWNDIIPAEIVTYLDMSMREVNRYYSSLHLIKGYLKSVRPFSTTYDGLVKYMLVPLAYGLRVHDFARYEEFITGKGRAIIEDFCSKSESARRLATSTDRVADTTDPVEVVKQFYDKLFVTDHHRTASNYQMMESAETFRKVVSLMNASGTIDDTPSTQ